MIDQRDRWGGPGRNPHSVLAFKLYYGNGRIISDAMIDEIDADLRNLDILDSQDGHDDAIRLQCREWLLRKRDHCLGYQEPEKTHPLSPFGVFQSAAPDKWAGFPGASDRNSGYDDSGRI